MPTHTTKHGPDPPTITLTLTPTHDQPRPGLTATDVVLVARSRTDDEGLVVVAGLRVQAPDPLVVGGAQGRALAGAGVAALQLGGRVLVPKQAR